MKENAHRFPPVGIKFFNNVLRWQGAYGRRLSLILIGTGDWAIFRFRRAKKVNTIAAIKPYVMITVVIKSSPVQ